MVHVVSLTTSSSMAAAAVGRRFCLLARSSSSRIPSSSMLVESAETRHLLRLPTTSIKTITRSKVTSSTKQFTNPQQHRLQRRPTTATIPSLTSNRLKSSVSSTTRKAPTKSTAKTTTSSSTSSSSSSRRKATWSRFAFTKETSTINDPLLAQLSHFLRQPRTIPFPRWITPKHYTFCYSELFGHSSFILVAFSYAVDDFLLLRCIAVAGSTAMLFFTYFHPHGRVLWLPFKWNVLFIAINSYRIGKVYSERYLADQLPEALLKCRDKNFYLMAPEDFFKLADIGKIREYKKGETVIEQDGLNPYVSLVLDGHLSVYRDGGFTYNLEEANFMSELGLHVGLFLTGSVESNCSVIADTDAKLLVWDRTELVDLMRRNSGVRRSLKAVLSWDIVRKLKAQRLLLSSNRIDNFEAWTIRRNKQTEQRYIAILHNLLSNPKANLHKRRKEIEKYRMIHHIDDDVHQKCLEECGWTPEEFEAGYKHGSKEWHADHASYWWRVQDSILTLFGNYSSRPGW